MNFLFPTDAIALQIKYRFDNFLVAQGHPEMVAGITENKCRLMAHTLLCKELRHWFLWHSCEERNRRLAKTFGAYPKEFFQNGWVSGALTRLMPGYENSIGQQSQYEGSFFIDLIVQVLDPIEGHINQILQKLFNDTPTWNVCLLKPLGHNLLLELKGDYRIWDWHYSNGNIRNSWDTNN